MTNVMPIGWNFNNSYTSLPKDFYTVSKPSPAKDPSIVLLNEPLANSLGLDVDVLQSKEGIKILAGNTLPKGVMNIAQAYAGHQFGGFTMLGDGRAIMLGEHMTPNGERFDLQWKGAGRTIYSRGGDGLASLGPMLREYIISEAMHGLRIPTSRSLAVVKSDDPVYREEVLSRAILTRVAKSHLRVGTFQFAAAYGNKGDIKALANYAIERHYPSLTKHPTPYLALLEQVLDRQAQLIAKWQLVGFIHGVMNTDNMTISGETIDYGPCAFMNTFDLNTVFSSIDTGGRYKYGNQPAIAHWNLTRFAETLLPLLGEDKDTAVKSAEESVGKFFPIFNTYWLQGMRQKLGLFQEEEVDRSLIIDLLDAMKKYKADYTDTFLALTNGSLDGAVLFHSEEFKAWHKRWQERLHHQEQSLDERTELMRQHNPALIPRNHLVEDALAQAVEHDNYEKLQELLVALANPFEHSQLQAELSKTPVPKGIYQTFCGT